MTASWDQVSIMYYIYLVRSIPNPDQHYVGFTGNLRERVEKHNEGGSPHTSKCGPWEVVTHIAFRCKAQAAAFEKYLKAALVARLPGRDCGLWNEPCRPFAS